jgi:hypothetical protein
MLLPKRRALLFKPGQLPGARPPVAPPARTQTPQPARRSVAAIESDRNRLFVELTRMRDACREPARPLQNALVLLTSSWSRANWRSREQLLKAVDWLLQLQSRRGV